MVTEEYTRFVLRAELTPEENVEAFMDHLKSRSEEFSVLLRRLLPQLLYGTDRHQARQAVNREVSAALDDLPKEEQ